MANKNAVIIADGTIKTDRIKETHEQIRTIVESFKQVNKEVSDITNIVKENWVGKGRNEFESQYKILINKIDDFGDTLQDIYEGLVKAETEYQTLDIDLKQNFKMAIGK